MSTWPLATGVADVTALRRACRGDWADCHSAANSGVSDLSRARAYTMPYYGSHERAWRVSYSAAVVAAAAPLPSNTATRSASLFARRL